VEPPATPPDFVRRCEELGEFTLLETLGRGGSGTVYAARSPNHPEVALKVLHADLSLSERERQRFFDEVASMRRLRHASLVALVDAGVLPDGRPYLCMPLLRGETLAARIRRSGPMPVDIALGYFQGLAEGVTALHRAGLVHRDIKPENIMLDEREGRAVLLDFGIARELGRPATTTTLRGRTRGTPAYMAPERFFGAPASVATDVYELAVVFYVTLVGQLPWENERDAAARLHPRSPRDFGVSVPDALVDVLMSGLSTRPQARPASAAALAEGARRTVSDDVAPARVTEDLAQAPAAEAPLNGVPSDVLPRQAPAELLRPSVVAWASSASGSASRRPRARWLIGALAAASLATPIAIWAARSRHDEGPVARPAGDLHLPDEARTVAVPASAEPALGAVVPTGVASTGSAEPSREQSSTAGTGASGRPRDHQPRPPASSPPPGSSAPRRPGGVFDQVPF
jgi:serine/threonine-protein kinase